MTKVDRLDNKKQQIVEGKDTKGRTTYTQEVGRREPNGKRRKLVLVQRRERSLRKRDIELID